MYIFNFIIIEGNFFWLGSLKLYKSKIFSVLVSVILIDQHPNYGGGG